MVRGEMIMISVKTVLIIGFFIFFLAPKLLTFWVILRTVRIQVFIIVPLKYQFRSPIRQNKLKYTTLAAKTMLSKE